MNRQINLMIATAFVFVLLISIFCWGTTSFNQVHTKQKAAIEQLKEEVNND
jgi:hypothetical protein